jgi:ribonuclease HI
MKPGDKIYPVEQTVTINCDASYNQKFHTGGWACWISYKDFKIQRYGKFKDQVNDSHECEIKSLCNSFQILENHFSNENIKLVFVNCDNQVVRHIIKTRLVREKFKTEIEVLLSYLSKYELIIAKTIYGHKRGDTPRQFVNNWCDEYSRKYLNK